MLTINLEFAARLAEKRDKGELERGMANYLEEEALFFVAIDSLVVFLL